MGLKPAEAELKNCATEEERIFLRSAMRGLLAEKRIAEKLAEAADRKLKTGSNPEAACFLEMISCTTRRFTKRWTRPGHERNESGCSAYSF